ncbi:hypothetical protein KCU89_g12463, partial [Aureobasidium melanogenum]
YVQSYSVLKYPWKAVPHYPPVAVPAPDKTSVFVSWNGATDVYAWHLSVLINENWQPHRKALKEGFETELELPNKDLGRDLIRYIIVEAVDEDGNVLGKTEIVDLWAKGLVSRITQMAPGNGGGFGSWVLLVCVIAVVVFIADRVVKSRRSGRVYQKLRKH